MWPFWSRRYRLLRSAGGRTQVFQLFASKNGARGRFSATRTVSTRLLYVARKRRIYQPGAVHHLITRFVNDEFRITDDEERDAYQWHLQRAVKGSDWRWLANGTMSNHTHNCALAGSDAPGQIVKRINDPFARWLNKRQGRRGPLVAGRFDCWIIRGRPIAEVIAYLHNNPVRAGVVAVAA